MSVFENDAEQILVKIHSMEMGSIGKGAGGDGRNNVTLDAQ